MTSFATQLPLLYSANFDSLRQAAEGPTFDGSDLLEHAATLLDSFEPGSEEAHRFSGVVSQLYDLSGDNRLNQANALATLDRLREATETSIVPGYSYFEMLSRGGEATVYRALQRMGSDGQLMALKVAHTFQETTPVGRARRLEKLRANFENEWNILHRFDSDRVLKAYQWGQTVTGKPYLVLEYMEAKGRHLETAALNVYVREKIRAHRAGTNPFPFEERLQIAIQMAAALAVFHEEDLIHNDVKLGNYLMNRRGQIKIADPSMTSSTESSSKHGLRGTPGHLAMETHPTLKKDVFALGTSLYILFTGKIPFDAGRSYSAMFLPPVPSTFDATIPRAMDRVVMKAIATPSERTPDAMTVLDSLEKIANRRGKSKRP